MKTKRLETDVLIIGGGTAGCFAAYTLGKEAGAVSYTHLTLPTN